MADDPLASRDNAWWKLVRFGFRLLYNEMAWTYDWVSWGVSLGHWRDWQRAALPHLSVERDALILELAHGTGDLQIDMLAMGLRPVGYDLSPFMGRIANRKMTRLQLKPKLVRGMAQRLPFASGQFAGVVSTFPTEFILDSQTLSEVYRVLRPNGRMVIVPNGQLDLSNVVTRLLEWLYTVTGQRNPWPNSLGAAYTEAGFTVETVTETLQGSQAQVIIAQK